MGAGDREPNVTDREILTVFDSMNERRLRPKEVADELPISVETLSDRLDDLHERGLLARADEKLPGVRWRLAPEATDGESLPEERVETDTEAQTTKVTGSETPPHEEETPETPPPDPQAGTSAPPHERSPDAIEAFDPPGTLEEKDLRRGALRRAYNYLRRRGRARRTDFESDVFPEAPGGYESPDEGWWRDVVRPGLDALPDVEAVGEGDEWRIPDATDVPDE